MSLLKLYLQKSHTQRILNRKPGEKGFSLIEVVVVIAVLAVLTAIALPNFLGVTEDASARTDQQAALNAYKECKVYWARNKRDVAREFSKPAITSWTILAQDGNSWTNARGKAVDDTSQGTVELNCSTSTGAERYVYAVPNGSEIQKKFPVYRISISGDRECKNGTVKNTTTADTFDIGCGTAAGNADEEGTWE